MSQRDKTSSGKRQVATAPVSEVETKVELPEPEYEMVTLGDLGYNLPVGIPSGEKYAREIAVRTFKFEQEKKIQEVRKRKGLTLGRMVSEVLAVMCTKLGPHNFDGMSHANKLLEISKMRMEDVLYTYFMVRYDALGGQLQINMTCANCNHEFVLNADIRDLDVVKLDGDHFVNFDWDYTLQTPATIRKEEVKILHCGPVLWAALDAPGMVGVVNQSQRDEVMMMGSVKGTDKHEELRLVEGELDDLHLSDKADFADQITSKMPGPKLFVEARCEKCDSNILELIDWSYELFFRRFSRSLQQRNSLANSSRSSTSAI